MSLPNRAVLLLAQGFGAGRLPVGPGSWGSLIGVVWLVFLLTAGSAWVWSLGSLLAILVAAPICTRAEILLGRHDPPDVVIDEIVAVPLIFLGPWIVLGVWPVGLAGQAGKTLSVFWPELLAGFLAFRLFDIWKPGPIGRLQRLPKGWGIVADDVLAALAASLLTGLVTLLRFR